MNYDIIVRQQIEVTKSFKGADIHEMLEKYLDFLSHGEFKLIESELKNPDIVEGEDMKFKFQLVDKWTTEFTTNTELSIYSDVDAGSYCEACDMAREAYMKGRIIFSDKNGEKHDVTMKDFLLEVFENHDKEETAMIKDSGERTVFETGAVRDIQFGKGRFDLLPWYAIHDVAKHCEEGAKKYGERNVDKGIPQHSLIDSAIRHLVRYLHNETDEPHLRAACWNLLWALEQETTHSEMIDLPFRNNDICEACEWHQEMTNRTPKAIIKFKKYSDARAAFDILSQKEKNLQPVSVCEILEMFKDIDDITLFAAENKEIFTGHETYLGKVDSVYFDEIGRPYIIKIFTDDVSDYTNKNFFKYSKSEEKE